ncbi:hypothetical protein COCVIDRAFT_13898 [Bipolaris victoriae FI3]|uniref:Uncharacterized protein n=1 Tax=Bipolaris victoriae (strain FI3) TaxID=930091 RepID=W7END7_BIPV3|nr:hypothetical protein COCVIDRAFT_13898 [Bipolaris victoriae FI3]
MSDEGPTCSLLGQNDWHTRPKSSDRHWWNEPRNGYQIAYGRDSEDAPYLRAGCGCSAAYTESSINMTDSFRLFLTREVTLHPVSDIQCIRACQYICLDFVNAITSNRFATPALPYLAVYAHAPGKLLRAVSVLVGCMDHFFIQSRS